VLLVVIVALIAVISYFEAEPLVSYSPTLTLVATSILCLVAPAYAWFLSRSVNVSADASETASSVRIVRSYLTRRWLLRILLLTAFCSQVFIFNWPLFVTQTLGLGRWLLVAWLGALLPLVASMLITWVHLFRLDAASRDMACSLRSYLDFQIRNQLLLPLIPFLVLVTLLDVVSEVPSLAQLFSDHVELHLLLLFVLVAAVSVLAPLLLRLIWKARPLADGPLRTHLLAVSRKYGFRLTDILVADTSGWKITNACVAGVSGALRYVFLTDALVENLTVDELTAVLGHELGHIRFRHIPFYLFYLVTFIFLTMAVDTGLSLLASAGVSQNLTDVAGIIVMALAIVFYWGFLFGYISRRFERQADIYGTLVSGSPVHLAEALEKIARLNGTPRNLPSWRHFKVDARVQFLSQFLQNPELADALRQSLKRAFLGFVAIAFVSYAVAVIGGFLGL